MYYNRATEPRRPAAAAENRGLDPTPSRVQGSIHNGTNTPVRVRPQLEALLPAVRCSLVVIVAEFRLPKPAQSQIRREI